jgi:hypothetical protein
LKHQQNGLDHAMGVDENLVASKTDYFPPLPFQPRRSARVRGAVRVLAAIDFDHQCVFGARKVDNEIADRMLSAKLVS